MSFAIGCHLSPSGGLMQMVQTGKEIGCTTFQFFARNPRGSKAKPLDATECLCFSEQIRNGNLASVLVHAPYTLNPCSIKAETVEFARQTLKDDLHRCRKMGVSLYNLHPGSHVGQGESIGIQKTSALISEIAADDPSVTVLLETMAGQGSEIGSSFESIAAILDAVGHRDRIGVCLDTCHVFAAGYDIVSDLDRVLTEFDRIIGLDRLKYVHLNDCKFGLGERKDRHAPIGLGEIGSEAFSRILRHEALRELPFCLETPHDTLSEYEKEIALVRRLRYDV